MKYIFSALITGAFVLTGIAASLYFFLYGGVVNIIDGFAAVPVDAGRIAVGAVRVLLTSFFVWLSVVVPSTIMLLVGGIFATMDE